LFSTVFTNRSFCIADERLTPCQAAVHPFLAPEFPCAYLLPWQGGKISGIIIVGINSFQAQAAQAHNARSFFF